MRNDLRPYWLKRATAAWNRAYSEWFLHPQMDAIGPGSRIINPRHFEVNGPNVRLGRDIHMMATADAPVRFSVWSDGVRAGAIEIGDYSILLPGARISSAQRVVLGRNCMMASHTYITDADWHGLYDRNTAPGASAEVRLEDNVWLGDSVIVCKGVTIGTNSVCGAGAVVADDVPPNTVVAGNPARVVKELDPDGPFRTRDEHFTGDVSYEDFNDAFDREILGRNSLFTWIRSRLVPGRED